MRAEEEQGDVVVAGRGSFGVVEECVGEGFQALGVCGCQSLGEGGGGVVDVGAGAFDESVGVQGEDGATRPESERLREVAAEQRSHGQ